MGRYCKYDRDKEAENAARRRNDGTKASDLLVGNQEEYWFLVEQLPILREEQESIGGTLTGKAKYQYASPTMDFVRRYNGPENTDLGGLTHQTSRGMSPQKFNPSTGAFFDMGVTAYEDIQQLRCLSVKTKHEAIISYLNARAASWHYMRQEGFKGAKDGYKGAEFSNLPPKPGKKARGRQPGWSPTQVNSEY